MFTIPDHHDHGMPVTVLVRKFRTDSDWPGPARRPMLAGCDESESDEAQPALLGLESMMITAG